MRKLIPTLLFMLLTTVSGFRAQEASYNFSRGLEAFEQGNMQEAGAYFWREAQENNNRAAWFYLAIIFDQNDQLGRALTSINKAIKLAEGDKDKKDLALCYNMRASFYDQLGDSTQMLDDINHAISLQPKDPSYQLNRGTYYMNHKNYALAQKDYLQVLNLAKGDCDERHSALCYLMACNKELKNYPEAIRWTGQVMAEVDTTMAWDMLGDIHMDMCDYNKAAEYYIKAYEQNDEYSTDSIEVIADSAYDAIAQPLRAKAQQTDSARWLFLLGHVALSSSHYNDALSALMPVVESDPDNLQALYYLAQAYESTGHIDRALQTLRRVGDGAPDDAYSYARGMMCLNDCRLDSARACAEDYLSKVPGDIDAYLLMGFVNEYECHYDEALDNFTFAVTMSDTTGATHLQSLYHRALIYKQMGYDEAANNDFEAVLALNQKDTRRARAAAHLKRRQLVEDIINEQLSGCNVDGLRKHRLRHAACAYAILGESDRALDYLEQALKAGYIDRDLLLYDPDLEQVRQMPRFKQLVDNQKPQPLPKTTK